MRGQWRTCYQESRDGHSQLTGTGRRRVEVVSITATGIRVAQMEVSREKNQGARGAGPGSEGKYGIVIVVKVVVVVDFAEMAAAVELTVKARSQLNGSRTAKKKKNKTNITKNGCRSIDGPVDKPGLKLVSASKPRGATAPARGAAPSGAATSVAPTCRRGEARRFGAWDELPQGMCRARVRNISK